MVRIAPQLGIALLLSMLLVVSCNRSENAISEGADLGMVDGALNRLSPDVVELLESRAITNARLLTEEYHRRFPARPPLFFAKPLKPVFPRDSEYQLPPRDYFWLREWSSSDPSTTPLFWSYFYVPNAVVSYLTIEGRDMGCSSNDFYRLVAPLSNRVERAQTEAISDVGGPKPKN